MHKTDVMYTMSHKNSTFSPPTPRFASLITKASHCNGRSRICHAVSIEFDLRGERKRTHLLFAAIPKLCGIESICTYIGHAHRQNY